MLNNIDNDTKSLTVGTHDGIFHADDVVALAIIMLAYARTTINIVRTRDAAKLAECDVVVDVGGELLPSANRYDHHQRGRAGARNNGVFYSGAGLIWRELGIVLCDGNVAVCDAVDQDFIQAIDATDNGQPLFEGGVAQFGEVRSSSLSSLISSLNPGWDEDKDSMPAFVGAVEITKTFLSRAIARARGEWAATSVVEQAVRTAGGSPIIEFEKFCPWQDVLGTIAPEGLFVVFPSETGMMWMVQCVPDAPGSFGKRKALPEAWAGVRDADFQKLTGVEDGVFCHPGLFICGAKSREGAMALAKQAL